MEDGQLYNLDVLNRIEDDGLKGFDKIGIWINQFPFDQKLRGNKKIRTIFGTVGSADKDWLDNIDDFVDIKILDDQEFNTQTRTDILGRHIDFHELLKFIFDDYDLYHIADRSYLGDLFLSQQDVSIFEMVVKCIDCLTSRELDLFIVPVTPHGPMIHVLTKCVEFLKIPIIHVRRASLPWRAIAELGLGRNAIPLKIKTSDTEPEIIIQKRHMDNYIRLFQSSYEDVIPIYEKQMATKYNGKLTNRLKNYWRWVKKYRSVNGLLTTLSMHKSLDRLVRSWQEPVTGERYVFFSLHVQPERTTLPEGGVFNQQINALNLLRMLLPDDIKIYVREHPSVYRRRRYREKFRPNDFYSRIQRIPNVFMVSSFLDNYELIDNSLFCASINGTVAIEAVARGKFCMYYGNAHYKNLDGAIHVDAILKNPQILNNIIERELVIDQESLRHFFMEQIRNSEGRKVNEKDFADYDIHYRSISDMIVRLIVTT
jgi:hypothetical protein